MGIYEGLIFQVEIAEKIVPFIIFLIVELHKYLLALCFPDQKSNCLSIPTVKSVVDQWKRFRLGHRVETEINVESWPVKMVSVDQLYV